MTLARLFGRCLLKHAIGPRIVVDGVWYHSCSHCQAPIRPILGALVPEIVPLRLPTIQPMKAKPSTWWRKASA